MAYPKPLSQKTIDKMFSTWKPETVEKLHKYYETFSELYGVITLSDAWKVFKNYEPRITKRDFMAFSIIVRREDVPYRIYEENELYTEELPNEDYRMIINKKLIGKDYGRYGKVYEVIELQGNKPYYQPENILSIKQLSPKWNEFHTFLKNLRSENGERLSKHTFMSSTDRISLEYYKSEQKRKKVYDTMSIPASERIYEAVLFETLCGGMSIDPLTSMLEEAEAVLTERKLDKMFDLLQEAVNNTHLWCNCGWTPVDLSKQYKNQGLPKAVVLGPGYQKAFENGELDKDEITEMFNQMGIEVID